MAEQEFNQIQEMGRKMGLDGGSQQPISLGNTRYIPENAGMPQPKQVQLGLKYKPPFG